jgi:hypothetical protein
MAKSREDIIKQKEILAQDTLLVAKDALDQLANQMEECSTRDLVSIFNSAIKAHREITSDIVALTQVDSKSEQELAIAYDGKVGELLKKLTGD